MNTTFEVFRALHQRLHPLLIGNVWDVQSALVFQNHSYEAIATSSAAVAASLGFADGEDMPFEDYFFVIKHIKRVTSIPFSVDLEGGFARDAENIAQNIIKLSELGVAGINLEDSVVINGVRSILPIEDFAITLNQLVEILKNRNIRIFINIRCDAFLLNLHNALDEGITRAKRYESAGINGIFMPCITDAMDIRTLAASIQLPLNVMCMPTLPDFLTLQDCGVKRISFGGFMGTALNTKMKDILQNIQQAQSFKALF